MAVKPEIIVAIVALVLMIPPAAWAVWTCRRSRRKITDAELRSKCLPLNIIIGCFPDHDSKGLARLPGPAQRRVASGVSIRLERLHTTAVTTPTSN